VHRSCISEFAIVRRPPEALTKRSEFDEKSYLFHKELQSFPKNDDARCGLFSLIAQASNSGQGTYDLGPGALFAFAKILS
jgi:hypothetical protein